LPFLLLTLFLFFFLTETATTDIYTLSLHDALPIWGTGYGQADRFADARQPARPARARPDGRRRLARVCAALRPQGLPVVPALGRSEEHTSELQSRGHLVCRLLLEKKKNIRRHESVR